MRRRTLIGVAEGKTRAIVSLAQTTSTRRRRKPEPALIGACSRNRGEVARPRAAHFALHSLRYQPLAQGPARSTLLPRPALRVVCHLRHESAAGRLRAKLCDATHSERDDVATLAPLFSFSVPTSQLPHNDHVDVFARYSRRRTKALPCRHAQFDTTHFFFRHSYDEYTVAAVCAGLELFTFFCSPPFLLLASCSSDVPGRLLHHQRHITNCPHQNNTYTSGT